jgi:cell division protein FtsB
VETFNWAGIVIAAIGVIAAWLSGRAARNAAKASADATMANVRTTAETEAYLRARSMDVATIDRQDKELTALRARVRTLEDENDALRRRMSELERGIHG